MITKLREEQYLDAANIHALAWIEAKKGIFPEETLAKVTAQTRLSYIQKLIDTGYQLYLLTEEKPIGMVAVKEDLIEALYILPSEQNKGHGTKLLHFAMEHCTDLPRLWIMDNNVRAQKLYERHGFRLTGNKKQLREDLYELEMVWDGRGGGI